MLVTSALAVHERVHRTPEAAILGQLRLSFGGESGHLERTGGLFAW